MGVGVNVNDERVAREDLERAIAGGRAEEIATAIVCNVWPLYNTHYELMCRALVSLPSGVLERHPILRALHPMTPVLARTIRPFRPLGTVPNARTADPDELDLTTLVHILASRMSGDEPGALSHAKRLEDRIAQVRTESRERTDGPLWYFHLQIGSTLLSAGKSARALLAFATARQLAALAPQPDAERLVLGRTALAHAVRGSLDDARRLLSEAAELPPPTPAHIGSSAATEAAAAALVAVDRMTDDLDERLYEIESYDSYEMSWPFALLARTRAHLARHQPDDALEVTRLAADSHPPFPGTFATDVITAMTIESLATSGDLSRAAKVVDADQRAEKRGILTRLALVRLALFDGDVRGATQDLRDLIDDTAPGPAQRAKITVLAAWLEFVRTGDVDPHTAATIAQLGTKVNHRRLFATTPQPVVDCVLSHLPAETAQAMRAALAGVEHMDVRERPRLTNRELLVLRALTLHPTTASIAAALHVSPNTIKSQLQSLYRKLGCSTREEAVQVASRLRLCDAACGSTAEHVPLAREARLR